MALNTINPHTESWKTAKHFDEMQKYYARMFQVDATRTKFNLKWNDFLIDYSKNIINQETY
jgi:glucose-6-phosphate isomerase